MSSRSPSWTVQDAKSQLSQILRRAREGTPQYIGRHERFVVMSEVAFQKLKKNGPLDQSLNIGKKMLAISPGIDDFELPEPRALAHLNESSGIPKSGLI